MHHVSGLDDGTLEMELRRLVACEPRAFERVVAHLAEFDARQLYARAGFPSLFTYCCAALRLADTDSYLLVEAARGARRSAGSVPAAC